MMIYTATKTFDSWIIKYQQRLLKINIYAVFLAFFTGFAISAGSKEHLDNGTKFGLAGVLVLLIFFLYAYLRTSFIFNRTIRQIDINDSEVHIKTYDFKIFALFPLKGKSIRIARKKLKIVLNEFPMKESRKAGPIECYILRCGETEYYLLYNEFDDAVVNDLVKS